MAESSEPAPQWLRWARELQSIAQAGLTFTENPYDVERYEQVRRVAAEIAAAGSAGDADQIEGFFADARGYPTPKLDVRAAVIVEDRILLVKEGTDGNWSMPGGWADIGESAAEAVERETAEEAGVEVRAVKLIALYERERHGHPLHPDFSYKAIFLCRPVSAALDVVPSPDDHETRGAAYFRRAELPPLSLMRVTEAQIELAFTHSADPRLPTEFD